MSLIRWDPFRDLDPIFEGHNLPSVNNFGWDLAVDVYEKDNKIIAKMQVPGIDPEKVDISFEDDQHLRISGSREEKQETEEKDYYSREIRQGSFERLVRLPAPVDQTAAEADYEDGVLTVTIPKKQEQVVDQIKIKVKKK